MIAALHQMLPQDLAKHDGPVFEEACRCLRAAEVPEEKVRSLVNLTAGPPLKRKKKTTAKKKRQPAAKRAAKAAAKKAVVDSQKDTSDYSVTDTSESEDSS